MAIVTRIETPTISQYVLEDCELQQGFISVRLEQGKVAQEIQKAVAEIKKNNQKIVAAFLVGNDFLVKEVDLKNEKFPVTILRGDPCNTAHADCEFGGIQFWVVKDVELKPILLDGKIVGQWFEDSHATYCYLGDVRPNHEKERFYNQTTEAFQNIDRALHTIGMDFLDVARTWCYLRNLLSWYDDFNAARTDFFKQKGVFQAMIPSSTGIGACLPEGPAIVLGALAVKAKDSQVSVKEVFSPLQCPAKDYRSSFARATEIETPYSRQLLISGTASIEPGGASAFIDDIENQIKLTFEVIGAILDAQKFAWKDCSRAIAYYKDANYLAAWKRYWKETKKPEIPIIHLHADVCRDDLLFEIELDCTQAK